MWRIIEAVKRLFYHLFPNANIKYYDLLEEYEINVYEQDLSCRNVLLGTVKSPEQYDINYRNCFYHIPSYLINDPKQVKYIALYRSKNIFNENLPGIVHYGSVISYSLVQRKDIRELLLSFHEEEYYYRFDVARWCELPNPIKVRELGPRAAILTNKFLLENCGYSNELFIPCNDMFKLYLAIMDMIQDNSLGFFVGDAKLRCSRNKIIIKRNSLTFTFSVMQFKRRPIKTTEMIFRHIFMGCTIMISTDI